MKTIIISVGNELTSGLIANSNSSWIAKQLEPLGITPDRIVTLRDDIDVLVKEIKSAVKNYDLALLTGGLGPTRDDVTKPALVKAYGTRLVRDGKALKQVEALFRKINRPLQPVNEAQADVPENCEVIINKHGTAPLLCFNSGGCMLFAMPGVPFEMKKLMKSEVLPRVRERSRPGTLVRKVLRTAGIGESYLAENIEKVYSEKAGVELAYLPHFGQVDIRITATGKKPAAAKKRLDSAVKLIKPAIKQYIYGEDEQTIEMAIGRVLKRKKLTLASAESCTGGLFASRITSVSGSSRYFLEGAVTYSDSAKMNRLKVKRTTLEKYGAVSAQTAAQMAKGICATSGARIGVSSTGIAGPTGGTKEKPVGLVHIGLCIDGKVETKELNLGRDRRGNQDRTAKEMANWVWRAARDIR